MSIIVVRPQRHSEPLDTAVSDKDTAELIKLFAQYFNILAQHFSGKPKPR
jgi:hypothetical protein